LEPDLIDDARTKEAPRASITTLIEEGSVIITMWVDGSDRVNNFRIACVHHSRRSVCEDGYGPKVDLTRVDKAMNYARGNDDYGPLGEVLDFTFHVKIGHPV
jgi:hypothetical protein